MVGFARPNPISASTAARTNIKKQVLNPPPPAGLLHADTKEAERAERKLLGLLPVEHVQDHRDRGGQRGEKEEGGEERHRVLFLLAMYFDSMKS